MTEAYSAALQFLYGRLNYERVGMPRQVSDLRIGRMRRLLRRLGDPQKSLRIVHVAGTKGKGSTAAMLAAVLTASGRRTGLFCSPHLHRLEERFQIDGREATPDQLIELTDIIRPLIAESDAHAEGQGRRGPTFFEVTTAMGLLHFARQGADAAVLEVGLGGRLDSTNVVRPALSIITSISHDHTRQLGTTLPAIAREKAGILKRGTPAIVGVTRPEPLEAIREIAAGRRAPLKELDRDFSFRYDPPPRPLDGPSAGAVTVQTWRRAWGPLPLPFIGPHQAHNAALALAAVDALDELGCPIDPADATRGLADARFPARFEVLGKSPWLIADGAHNVASAAVLAETLRVCTPESAAPRTLVFGTTRDKDLEGQLRALTPGFDRFVATRYRENPRAVPEAEVAEAIRRLTGREPLVEPGPEEALAAARRITPADGLICVTGSLFLVAEIRALLLGIDPIEAPFAVAP